ncbi:MAG TPA: hypothetical protein VHT51_17235 [Micropepsaceae bacterium]|nr:hypothetical protein [Micropepsaceae bacterium]
MPGAAKPFNRETLEQAFQQLGQIAHDMGKVVEISIYGGSALVLTTDFRVATQDVDAVFESDRAFVRRAAETIANDFGWSVNWINDGVKGFLSAKDAEQNAKSLFRTYPAEGQAGLRVFVASPSYLFAMKCLAMRVGGVEASQDISDIRNLGRLLGIKNAKQAAMIVSRYYPAEMLPPKTRFGLEEIFGDSESKA